MQRDLSKFIEPSDSCSQRLAKIRVGVCQGCILNPLLFLTCINDLSDNLECNPKFW